MRGSQVPDKLANQRCTAKAGLLGMRDSQVSGGLLEAAQQTLANHKTHLAKKTPCICSSAGVCYSICPITSFYYDWRWCWKGTCAHSFWVPGFIFMPPNRYRLRRPSGLLCPKKQGVTRLSGLTFDSAGAASQLVRLCDPLSQGADFFQ